MILSSARGRPARPRPNSDLVKLIFLNRYFHPDISATSQLLSDLAFGLAAQGREVHVIASRQRYDDPDAQLPAEALTAGVQVHRVRTSRFGRQTLPGRALDYLSFYVSASFALARLAARGDTVIAMTDPPLLSVPAALVARLRGARLVNWLQDVFPEVAARMGVGLARGLPGALLRALRNASLRSAAVNVVLGERMRAEVQSVAGLEPVRLAVVHNWADGEAIVPLPRGAGALRGEWGLGGKFVVAYSGNMGRVHEFATILAAAEKLRAQAGIVFVFIGGGHHRAWIEAEATGRGLANVVFRPYQPAARLTESLGLADVHLTCLLPGMEGLVVPSKVYGILASGRATLHVGDPAGEVAGLLESAQAGYTVATGDAAALAERIVQLAADTARCTALGRNARAAFDARYHRGVALERWAAVLDQP